ncbi:6-bladed beta-propeller [Pedobacter psychrodurus]|uniref:6-bladed beta-propeller n=1 Tax=Pedobacter psychrodurus TaxID=2530456 RepID=UPI00292D275F|nr:6-bladed beta-propeller [Pedobacter psychrodurus]
MKKNNIGRLMFYSLMSTILTVGAFAQELPKIRINPVQAYGGKVSEYFEKVEYIPLETSKKCMLGYVTRLIVTDSSFVVYDADTHSVYFFTLLGKFITKIKGKAESLGENIEFNNSLNCIEFSRGARSSHTREKKYYSKSGKLIDNNNEAPSSSKNPEMLPFGNGYFALANGCFIPNLKSVKDSIVYRLETYKNDILYKSLLPVNQKENEAICAINGFLMLPERVDGNAFYISTPLDYKVYHVDKDDAKPVFQFVFPRERVFAKEILTSHDKELIKATAEKYFLNPDPLKIMNVSNIFYKGDNLFFKINPRIYVSSGGSEIEHQYNFIFNTTTEKLVSLERLVGDGSNYFLPIFNERMKVEGLNEFEKGVYYSNISSFNMFASLEATKDKKPQYPATLQDYFKTQNRKSNPVIVRMKLKE